MGDRKGRRVGFIHVPLPTAHLHTHGTPLEKKKLT